MRSWRGLAGLLLFTSLCSPRAFFAQNTDARNTQIHEIESLIQQHRLNEARTSVLDLLKRDPSNVEGYNLLGIILGGQQDYQGAATSFQTAIRLKPDSVKSRDNLASLYMAQNHPDLAEPEFKAVLRLDPENRDAHYGLGAIALLKGSPSDAIVYFRRVHPQDQATRFELVRAYFATKQNALALRTASDLSAANPQDVQVHFSLGVLLASQRQYSAAQLEFEKADALRPGTFEILFNLGEDMLRSGENAKAEAVLRRALDEKPSSPEAMYLLAQACANQSRPLDALDLLVRANKLAPENTDILFLMAQISMSQNYFEDAIPLLESGVRLAPRRPEFLAALGESYFMAGKVDKAIDEFSKLIEVEKSARSYAFLGLCYRNMGRFDEARQQFMKGLKLEPNNSLCLYNLGFISERQGDNAAAEKYFQQSLRSNPDFPDTLLELANLRIAEKRLPEAEDLLRRFVRVSRDPSTGYYKLAMTERSLHESAAAQRDLEVFKTLSRSAPDGPHPYQNLFDYLENRSQLGRTARNQLDIDDITKQTREHPDQPEGMYLLVQAYLRARNLEQARETIAQLDKLTNGDYRTLTGLGVLLARYHVYGDAVEQFQAALAANPNSDDARFDLADALFRERKYADALEQAQKISPEAQKDDACLALLGDIYSHLGKTAQAIEIYRDAIARNPDNDQNYLSLALIQLRTSDVDSAKQALLNGQKRIPASGKIFWGLGLVAVLEGNNTQAATEFERAVDLLPEWPGGYSALGVFYFQSGQIGKAREVLSRFRNTSASSSLDVDRIEQVLDQASATSTTPSASLSMADRAQFLQLALSLADRTL
ncbi:MAG TPA: tetratricopeptide repeat protein [Terracidiphilus sp.]|nr:tetratricopeptide repeat protein [Terracidiphilus sp.]